MQTLSNKGITHSLQICDWAAGYDLKLKKQSKIKTVNRQMD